MKNPSIKQSYLYHWHLLGNSTAAVHVYAYNYSIHMSEKKLGFLGFYQPIRVFQSNLGRPDWLKQNHSRHLLF